MTACWGSGLTGRQEGLQGSFQRCFSPQPGPGPFWSGVTHPAKSVPEHPINICYLPTPECAAGASLQPESCHLGKCFGAFKEFDAQKSTVLHQQMQKTFFHSHLNQNSTMTANPTMLNVVHV